jgi:hypothetical protein
MAHQITLNDKDYTRLLNAAKKQGIPIEEILHETITTHIMEQAGSYRRPSGEPVGDAVLQENERLAALIGSAKPWASEMVLEDRGPR